MTRRLNGIHKKKMCSAEPLGGDKIFHRLLLRGKTFSLEASSRRNELKEWVLDGDGSMEGKSSTFDMDGKAGLYEPISARRAGLTIFGTEIKRMDPCSYIKKNGILRGHIKMLWEYGRIVLPLSLLTEKGDGAGERLYIFRGYGGTSRRGKYGRRTAL